MTKYKISEPRDIVYFIEADYFDSNDNLVHFYKKNTNGVGKDKTVLVLNNKGGWISFRPVYE